MNKVIVSHALCALLIATCPQLIFGEEIQTREKNKEVIASHVVGIVNNIVNLASDPKDEDEIGANIVGLFGNILGCIFAATKRSDIPFDMSSEEIDLLFASLDQEIIDAVHKAIKTRTRQIRSM